MIYILSFRHNIEKQMSYINKLVKITQAGTA